MCRLISAEWFSFSWFQLALSFHSCLVRIMYRMWARKWSFHSRGTSHSVHLFCTLKHLSSREYNKLIRKRVCNFLVHVLCLISWIMRAVDQDSNTLSTVRPKIISFISNLGGEIIFNLPQKLLLLSTISEIVNLRGGSLMHIYKKR